MNLLKYIYKKVMFILFLNIFKQKILFIKNENVQMGIFMYCVLNNSNKLSIP